MSALLRTHVRRSLSKLKHQALLARLALSGNPVYAGKVDLDDVLIGEQCSTPLEKWVERTQEWNRASCRLKESPYVRLLQNLSADENRLQDNDFLEAQSYYRMAQVAVAYSGSYFGAKTPREIRRQMRGYYDTFACIRDGRRSSVRYDDYRHSAHGQPLEMSKVCDSTCYELSDGHHRAAILYVLGRRRVVARILGEKATYLQQLIRQAERTNARELDQPIACADVRGWTVRNRCRGCFDAIMEFLRRQNWQHSVQTVLVMPASYGWFVDQLRRQGLNAIGISPKAAHVKIGRIAFGLTGDVLGHQRSVNALRQPDQKYDMVLFLGAQHPYALTGRQDADGAVLRLLDRIAGRILILDPDRVCEPPLGNRIPNGNGNYIRQCIRQYTTFQQVIPLGIDCDRAAEYATQSGRTLFACIR